MPLMGTFLKSVFYSFLVSSKVSLMNNECVSLFFLFISAYNVWVISPPSPHTLPYHPLRPLPLPPTPSLPGRNYFALISNFVEERV
jgi:hypothetical protein